MASAHYNKTLKLFMEASLNLPSDTIKVRLSRVSAYVFSQTHAFVSDLAASIVTDVTLGTKATNGGDAAHPGDFSAANATFTAVGAGAAIDSCIVYKDTGVAGTSPLICYLDGFTVTPNGGDITLQWASSTPYIFHL